MQIKWWRRSPILLSLPNVEMYGIIVRTLKETKPDRHNRRGFALNWAKFK